jgi:hypothetical protein
MLNILLQQWQPSSLLAHTAATMGTEITVGTLLQQLIIINSCFNNGKGGQCWKICHNNGNKGKCWLTMTLDHNIATMALDTTVAFDTIDAFIPFE